MDMSVYQIESVGVVETSPDRVGLEDVEFKIWTRLPGTIHEGTANTPALIVRIDKDTPDFVVDESQKAHYTSIGLINHRLCHWNPNIGDFAAFRYEEVVAEKRVGYQRRPIPDIKQLL